MENFKEQVLKKANEIISGEDFTDMIYYDNEKPLIANDLHKNEHFEICKSVFTETFYVVFLRDRKIYRLI